MLSNDLQRWQPLPNHANPNSKEHGAKVYTEKLDKPFVIGGVGNGTQTCHFRPNIDLAVPETNGSATTMNWTPPIVEGTGEGLPGLLGLNSFSE